MLDPYSVLEVNSSADDAEVKKAYRALSKKYHPDNNPDDKTAEERFKQVQVAYEQIMRERKYGSSEEHGFSGFSGFTGHTSNSDAGYGSFEQDLKSAAVYIRNGYYDQALNVLNGMSERDARWYYFSAISNLNLGRNVTALEHARMAESLDPSNYDYRILVENIENGNSWYKYKSNEYDISSGRQGNLCLKFGIAILLFNLCSGGSGLLCYSGNMCLGGPYNGFM